LIDASLSSSYWAKFGAGYLDEEYETLQRGRPWEWSWITIDMHMLLMENQIPSTAIRIFTEHGNAAESHSARVCSRSIS